MLYLDPHTVQPVVDESTALLSYGGCSSFHTQHVYSMAAQQLDPSMALGFYIAGWRDWHSFLHHARSLEERHAAYALVRVKATRGWRPSGQYDSDSPQQQQRADGSLQRPLQATQRASKAPSLSSISASLQTESSSNGQSDDEEDDEFVLL